MSGTSNFDFIEDGKNAVKGLLSLEQRLRKGGMKDPKKLDSYLGEGFEGKDDQEWDMETRKRYLLTTIKYTSEMGLRVLGKDVEFAEREQKRIEQIEQLKNEEHEVVRDVPQKISGVKTQLGWLESNHDIGEKAWNEHMTILGNQANALLGDVERLLKLIDEDRPKYTGLLSKYLIGLEEAEMLFREIDKVMMNPNSTENGLANVLGSVEQYGVEKFNNSTEKKVAESFREEIENDSRNGLLMNDDIRENLYNLDSKLEQLQEISETISEIIEHEEELHGEVYGEIKSEVDEIENDEEVVKDLMERTDDPKRQEKLKLILEALEVTRKALKGTARVEEEEEEFDEDLDAAIEDTRSEKQHIQRLRDQWNSEKSYSVRDNMSDIESLRNEIRNKF